MSGLKISQLTAAAALDGTELTPVVQSGLTKSTTVSQLATSVLSTLFIGATVTVNTFADLPAASSYNGKFAWVLNSTGMLFTKKVSGWYLSNGTAWTPADPPTSAASGVSVNNAGLVHTTNNDVQDVLADLDAALVTGGTSSTANALARYNGTTGKILQNSGATLDNSGNLTVANLITPSINIATASDFSIGNAASASGGNSVAIGAGATATGLNSIAIGPDDGSGGAFVDGAEGSVAIGPASYAYGLGGVAIGESSAANGDGSIAIGPTSANGTTAISIGFLSIADGSNAIAIGANADAAADYSYAFGGNVETDGVGSMAFGAINAGASSLTTKISGANSIGFVMTRRSGTLSIPKTMMVLGGGFLVDPNASGSAITTQQATIDFGRATDALIVPTGTAAQRPTALNGMIRYNTTAGTFEGYIAGAWKTFTLT